jgi:hypothetical protein
MLDPRVAAVRTQDSIIALGMRFRSEDEVNAEANRRDSIAGRKLNPLELLMGISNRVDDRDQYTRISQAAFSPVFDTVHGDDMNPFRSDGFKAAKQAAFGEGKQTRKDYFKQAEREADEKEEREAALAADKASPERAAAIEWAEAHWRSIAFDPNQPLSAVVAAENLRKQASTPGASLTALKSMSVAAVAQQQVILADRRDKASQARLAATAAFDAANIVPTSYAGTPGVGAGDTVTVVDELRGNREVRIVSESGVVKNSWPESEAPPEIRSAVQS